MCSAPIASQTVSASLCLCLSICHSGVRCVRLPQSSRLYRFLSGWQTTSGQSAPETGRTFSPFRIKISPINTRNDCNFSLSAGSKCDLRGKDEHKVTAMSVDFCVQLHILQISPPHSGVDTFCFQKYDLRRAVAAQPRRLSMWTAARRSLCTAASWRRTDTSENHRRGGESRWAHSS